MLVLVGCYWSLPLSYDPDVWHLYDTFITKVLMPVVLNVFALWTADSFLQAGLFPWVTSPTSGNLSPKANSSDGEELQADIQILKFTDFTTLLLTLRSESPWSLAPLWGVMDQFCRLESDIAACGSAVTVVTTWPALHTDWGGRGDGWHDHVFPGMEAEWKTGLVRQKELSSWAALQDLPINQMSMIHAAFSIRRLLHGTLSYTAQ